MFLETPPPKTAKLLRQLKSERWLKDFYLAGGTALALHYGHRQSVDLDFFSVKNFSNKLVLKRLTKFGRFDLRQDEEGTLEGFLKGVKISFLRYPYKLLRPPVKVWGVAVARPADIALMKLSAIAGRNSKKDFIDLYFYLRTEKTDLSALLAKMNKKFVGVNYDWAHLLKSLVYFAEADREPLPKMFTPISWLKIKKYFLNETARIIKF